MITAGIDLSTEPAKTALATVKWTSDGASVLALSLDVDDACILEAASRVTKLGLDCPLGWPDDFVSFLEAQRSGCFVAPEDIGGKDWRRRLAYRETDRVVQQATGVTPLSVATDRLGLTAMRGAGLLARFAKAGQPVDRAGGGIVVEVYPAASLQQWHLSHHSYKGAPNRPQLSALLDALLVTAPWLRLGGHADLLRHSDHAFDALVAALTSRAAALSQTQTPATEVQRHSASREGWIALPVQPLDALVPDRGPAADLYVGPAAQNEPPSADQRRRDREDRFTWYPGDLQLVTKGAPPAGDQLPPDHV